MCRRNPVPARWLALRVGLTVKQFARDVGCTPEHLSGALNGRALGSPALRQRGRAATSLDGAV